MADENNSGGNGGNDSGTIVGLIALGAGLLAAFHFKDEIKAFVSSAPAPPPASPESTATSSTAAAAAPPAAVAPPASAAPFVAIVRQADRIYPAGTVITTTLDGGKHSQLWTVGPDGRQITSNGPPTPATPVSLAKAVSDKAAGQPLPATTKAPVSPTSQPGTSSPVKPAAGAASSALAIPGLPPAAQGALGTASKLLPSGAQAALSGVLQQAGGIAGAGKALGGILGGASGAGDAASGAASDVGGAATDALSDVAGDL